MAEIYVRCDYCDNPAAWQGTPPFGRKICLCETHYRRQPLDDTCSWTPLINNGPKRKCVCCGKVKPLNSFYRYFDSRGVERFRNECKECNLARRRIRK